MGLEHLRQISGVPAAKLKHVAFIKYWSNWWVLGAKEC